MDEAVADDGSVFKHRVAIIVLTGIVYLAYFAIPLSKRKDVNERVILAVRGKLNKWLNWPFMAQLDPRVCESGSSWRLLPLAFCFQTFVTSLLLLLDGRYMIALNAFLSFVLILLGVCYAPQNIVLVSVRFVSFHQFTLLFLIPQYYSDPASIKRAIFGRGFASIAFSADLGEAFLHMALLTIAFGDLYGWTSYTSTMPILFFMQVIVPVHFLGVREYICMCASAGGINFGNIRSPQRPYYLAIIMSIPVITLLYTMTSSMTSTAQFKQVWSNSASVMTGVVHLAVGLLCLISPQVVDLILGSSEEWRLVDGMNKRIAPLGPLTLLDFIFVISCLCALLSRDPIAIAICFLMAPLALLSKTWRRTVVMATYILISLRLQVRLRANGEHITLLVLSTVRLGFATEKRPLSGLLRDTAFLTSVIILAAALLDSPAPHAGFFGMMTSCLSTIISWGRLTTARMLERERESAAFLAHAVKQKFSGVGGALEDVLARLELRRVNSSSSRSGHNRLPRLDEDTPFEEEDTRRSSNSDSNATDDDNGTGDKEDNATNDGYKSYEDEESFRKRNSLGWYVNKSAIVGKYTAAVRNALSGSLEQDREREEILSKIPSFIRKQISHSRAMTDMQHILRIALGECHQGERLCHAVNVASNINNSRLSLIAPDRICLAHQLLEWQRDSALFLTNANGLNIDFEPSLMLDTQWDSLKITLCTWVYGASSLRVSYNPNLSVIRFERTKGRKVVLSILKRLARTFGGYFESENVLEIRRALVVFSPLSPSKLPRLTQSFSKDIQCELPKGLVIAVLDDNALVRRHIERICRSVIQADPAKSFYIGETSADCEEFAERIIHENVDIAIFDENLEYENVHLSGTALAERARALGFKGCMVLHSAVTAATLELPSCFDGYVEKGMDRSHFCTELTKAYYARKSSNQQSE